MDVRNFLDDWTRSDGWMEKALYQFIHYSFSADQSTVQLEVLSIIAQL